MSSLYPLCQTLQSEGDLKASVGLWRLKRLARPAPPQQHTRPIRDQHWSQKLSSSPANAACNQVPSVLTTAAVLFLSGKELKKPNKFSLSIYKIQINIWFYLCSSDPESKDHLSYLKFHKVFASHKPAPSLLPGRHQHKQKL